MAEAKAKSLQQKLGFFDEDLKSPDHDRIMKWLNDNINLVIDQLYDWTWDEKTIEFFKERTIEIKDKELIRESENLENKKISREKSIKSLSEYEDQLKEELENEKIESDIYKSSKWTAEQIEKTKEEISKIDIEIENLERKLKYLQEFSGLENDLPIRCKPRVTKIQWEYTVTNQTYNPVTGYKSPKSIIGFVDMRVDFIYSRLTVDGLDLRNEQIKEKLKWNQTEKCDQYEGEMLYKVLLVEVKTKIPSLGELFRQLNTYKEYVGGDFLVVCPDDSNKEIINNQGFKFYKYK